MIRCLLALLWLAAALVAAQAQEPPLTMPNNTVYGRLSGTQPFGPGSAIPIAQLQSGGTLGGVLTGTLPNPGMAAGAAAANVGALGGILTGMLPAPGLNASTLFGLFTAGTNMSITCSTTCQWSVTGPASATNLAAGQPVFGNGAGAMTTGTLSGNTTKVATTTGTLTSAHCVQIDANGNFVDAGGACTTGGGGGTVSAGTTGQLTTYAANGTVVSGENFATLAQGGLGASQAAATANQIPVFPGSSGAAAPTSLNTWLTNAGNLSESNDAYFGSGRPWCDIMAQGAVSGNNIANAAGNTTAFNTCFAKQSGTTVVYVPPGVFCVTGITIPPNATVIGASESATTIADCGSNTAPTILMQGSSQGSRLQHLTIQGYNNFGAGFAALELAESCGCFVDYVRTLYGLGIVQGGPEVHLHHVVPALVYPVSATVGSIQFYNGVNFPGWSTAKLAAHVSAGGFIDKLFSDSNGVAFAAQFNTAIPSCGVSVTAGCWQASTSYAQNQAVVCCSTSSPAWGYVIYKVNAGANTSGLTPPTMQPYGTNMTDSGITWQMASAFPSYGAYFDTGTNQAYVNEGDFTGGFYDSIRVSNNPYPTLTAGVGSSGTSLQLNAAPPGWVRAGMLVKDVTTPSNISAGATVATVGVGCGVNCVALSPGSTTAANGDVIQFTGPDPHDIICNTCTISPTFADGVYATQGYNVFLSGQGQVGGGPYNGAAAVHTDPGFTGPLQLSDGVVQPGCTYGVLSTGGTNLAVNGVWFHPVWAGCSPTGVASLSQHIKIENNAFSTVTTGINLTTGNDYAVVVGNDFSQTGTPISGTVGSNNVFSGNAGIVDSNPTTPVSWTPALTFGGGSTGITYSTQVARYYRIGKQITANFDIILTSKGSSTGTAQIGGLPFASDSTGSTFASIACGFYSGMSGLGGGLGGILSAGSTSILLLAFGSSSVASVTDATFSNTSQVSCSLTYFTN